MASACWRLLYLWTVLCLVFKFLTPSSCIPKVIKSIFSSISLCRQESGGQPRQQGSGEAWAKAAPRNCAGTKPALRNLQPFFAEMDSFVKLTYKWTVMQSKHEISEFPPACNTGAYKRQNFRVYKVWTCSQFPLRTDREESLSLGQFLLLHGCERRVWDVSTQHVPDLKDLPPNVGFYHVSLLKKQIFLHLSNF